MSELAHKLIEENKISKDRFLDLGNCGIVGKIPEEIGECTWLEELNFSGVWTDWSETGYIERRTTNNGVSNNIAELPASLTELTGLQKLWIKGAEAEKFDITDLSFVAGLTRLKVFSCSYTQCSSLDFFRGWLI